MLTNGQPDPRFFSPVVGGTCQSDADCPADHECDSTPRCDPNVRRVHPEGRRLAAIAFPPVEEEEEPESPPPAPPASRHLESPPAAPRSDSIFGCSASPGHGQEPLSSLPLLGVMLAILRRHRI